MLFCRLPVLLPEKILIVQLKNQGGNEMSATRRLLVFFAVVLFSTGIFFVKAGWAAQDAKVAFYANITAIEPIMEAFTKTTGIKGEYTRISTAKFLSTVFTEFEAGKLMADVIQAPLPVLEMLKEKGVISSYVSPAATDYPDWANKNGIQLFGIEWARDRFFASRLRAPFLCHSRCL
jgi:iron(III) transport system substrate-binding protein